MKLKLSKVFIALCAILLASCKKQEIKTTPLANIQITNAVIGGNTLQFGTNTAPIINNSYTSYGILTGSQVLKLMSSNNPNSIYYNQTKDFVNGGVYSLFLAGVPSAVESVFLKEANIPSHTIDVFGARIINLSPNSTPISVNLKGSSKGSFVSTLEYKSLSTFKDVSSKADEGDKIFEFRNANTGDLITTFVVPSYDMPRFRNITIVYAGVVGSETVLRNNNY